MITVKNIRKAFKDLVVLDGIDLEVKRGEVVAIIGPSGSGKSTLLRCLNLLERPDQGLIEIGEAKLNAEKFTRKEAHRFASKRPWSFKTTICLKIKRLCKTLQKL